MFGGTVPIDTRFGDRELSAYPKLLIARRNTFVEPGARFTCISQTQLLWQPVLVTGARNCAREFGRLRLFWRQDRGLIPRIYP
jgi:hypothetical protein